MLPTFSELCSSSMVLLSWVSRQLYQLARSLSRCWCGPGGGAAVVRGLVVRGGFCRSLDVLVSTSLVGHLRQNINNLHLLSRYLQVCLSLCSTGLMWWM